MARKVLKTKVGQLISLDKHGLQTEQIQGVYTVFNHELALGLVAGKVNVEEVSLTEENGVIEEKAPNILLDDENRLQYYSLIPRKSDEVAIIIKYE